MGSVTHRRSCDLSSVVLLFRSRQKHNSTEIAPAGAAGTCQVQPVVCFQITESWDALIEPRLIVEPPVNGSSLENGTSRM